MKKNLLLLLLIGICLTCGFIYFIDFALEREEATNAVGIVRYLNSAVQMYSKDASASGKAIHFPDSLQELVRENYLNKGDLLDFGDLVIEIIRPDGDGKPTDVIIRTRTSDKLITCSLAGDIQIKKLR